MVKLIVTVLVGVVVVGVVFVALARGLGGDPVIVAQPIAFNHQLHLTEAGLDCTTLCHSAAASEMYAGLPSKHVCYECHDPDEDTPDSPELTRLAEYIDLDEDLPWKRVAITEPDVFFSHRRHVTAGQIECARCHPGVAEAAEPLSQVTLVLSMDDCLACHEQNDADNDCLACHR